jgi:hypothetical protein
MILKPCETKKLLFVKICVKDKNYFPKNSGDCNSWSSCMHFCGFRKQFCIMLFMRQRYAASIAGIVLGPFFICSKRGQPPKNNLLSSLPATVVASPFKS